jgi:TRAP-type C4-dicarboxylate transport system permease small subunit
MREKGEKRRSPVLELVAGFNRIVGNVVNTFEVVSLCFGVASLAGLLIANVFAREFFKSIYFVEEVSEFLVIFTTFVGVSYAVRKARHIRMGAFFDMMGPRLEKIFIFVISTISAVVMFLMARYSLAYLLESRAMGQSTEALRLPYWTFLIIIPIGFFLAGIQYVRTIIRNIVRKREVWMSPEQQSEYEEEG